MAKSHLLPSVSRRALLAGIAGAGGIAIVPRLLFAAEPPIAPPSCEVFAHGVASGDPDADSVIIWTRINAEGPVDVTWEVSPSPEFSSVFRRGTFRADSDRDHTVKVLVDGLAAGSTSYYRFSAKGAVSPVGKARTLPTGRIERLGIALATCSNYAFGYFNAYDAIAKDAAVDFVLHVGDYIYEYGADQWGGQTAHQIGRVHQPAGEIVSLSDYRTRHAQYKSDAGSRAMHGALTLLACWDDHEVCNNPWTGGAQNHQPATEGDWVTRRTAALRAYYEWMPVRDPALGHSMLQFWRRYDFGDLAMLHTLETRHTARAKQIDYLDYAATLTSPAAVAKFRADVLGAPGRRMISAELEKDLSAALAQSVAAGQPWRLIGNPSVIARTDFPDLAALGLLPDPMPRLAAAKTPQDLAALAADPTVSFAWRGHWGLPWDTDPWDGYPWARQRFYDMSRAAGATDLIFLSGDSHSFWANKLVDDGHRPAGLEFGTAGISSPGDFIASGFAPELSRKFDQAMIDKNPEVLWTTNMDQGYVRIELTRERGSATYVAMSNLRSTAYSPQVIKRVEFARKGAEIDFV